MRQTAVFRVQIKRLFWGMTQNGICWNISSTEKSEIAFFLSQVWQSLSFPSVDGLKRWQMKIHCQSKWRITFRYVITWFWAITKYKKMEAKTQTQRPSLVILNCSLTFYQLPETQSSSAFLSVKIAIVVRCWLFPLVFGKYLLYHTAFSYNRCIKLSSSRNTF